MVVAKSVKRQEILEAYPETFPVRTPGAIQPHGILLAINPQTFIVEQVSQNIKRELGLASEDILGHPLQHLISKQKITQLKSILEQHPEQLNPFSLRLSIQGKRQTFEGVIHQTQTAIILELELTSALTNNRFLKFHGLVKETLFKMQRVTHLPDFLSLITEEIQALTTFDRVMVYRFDQEGAGVVEAESKVEHLSPYLGLHFPSIDIPVPARQLFQESPVRLIPNIDYEPVPLETARLDSESQPLDLGRAILRQASPCHLQYLRNMGVAATMVIPLIKDQQLWGLIACHHQTAKYISGEVRTACEFLGQVIGLELTNKVNYNDLSYQKSLQTALSAFIEAMAQAPNLKTALIEPGPGLLSLVSAQGAAVCLEGDIALVGTTPEADQVDDLLQWANHQAEENIYYTDVLAEQYSPAEAFQSIASGLLLLQISQVRQYSILWFRPEVTQTVAWAGDPQAEIDTSAHGTLELSPRKSFEIWQETVHHCALPWRNCEIEIAKELRLSLVGLVLNKADELAELNLELKQSNQELDSFAYAASHDLQEPLRGIHNYTAFVLEDAADTLDSVTKDRLETIMGLTRRMQALIEALLHFSRLGQTELQLRSTDLNQSVTRIVQLLKVSRNNTALDVRMPKPLPLVQVDPVLIEELLSNLISNALKYNKNQHKWVEIGYFSDSEAKNKEIFVPTDVNLSNQLIFYVKDNGIGIRKRHLDNIFRLFKRLHGRNKYGGGTGAGLTIARKIIERHGGQIWAESIYGQGSAFYFTLGE